MTEAMKYRVVPIKGMHCASCELLIEEELKDLSGVEKVEVDHARGRATVFFRGASPTDDSIAEAVRQAGYEVGEKGRTAWFSRNSSAYFETLIALFVVGTLYFIGRSQGIFSISLGATDRLGSLPFVFVVGLTAGISTCMAIVGGLVLAVSARFSELHPQAGARKKFVPHFFFNIGRIVGFAVFGGLLGLLGSTMQPSSFLVGVLTTFVAVVMVVIGLQLLELFPALSVWKLTLPKSIAKILGVQVHSRKEYSHSRAAFLGAITFFLPCGFTQAVQLFVVTQGNMVLGALTMGVFALGTAPGLLGIGGLSSVARGAFGRYFFRSAGIAVIALGVFNFQNGVSLLNLGVSQSTTPEKSAPVEEQGMQQEGEPQVIHMDQLADGYVPNEFTVRKEHLVRWVIDSKESYSCAVSLTAPKIGVKKILKPGENVITFTPKAVGDIPFSCSMGMYRGVIRVIE
ncbi:MAG: sulfite exporter TauE/SafE family protein [Candidatus Moranbacteria bacterium]|nr:sulfite exporter TauE/SafE family protein [Candidatus Moranbacteria bacterium]